MKFSHLLSGVFCSFALMITLLITSVEAVTYWTPGYYEKEYTKGWWKLCLIPVFFYCSFSCIAFFPRTLYEDPENIPGILCFVVTMFVSYIVVLQYVESEATQKNIYSCKFNRTTRVPLNLSIKQL